MGCAASDLASLNAFKRGSLQIIRVADFCPPTSSSSWCITTAYPGRLALNCLNEPRNERNCLMVVGVGALVRAEIVWAVGCQEVPLKSHPNRVMFFGHTTTLVGLNVKLHVSDLSTFRSSSAHLLPWSSSIHECSDTWNYTRWWTRARVHPGLCC